MVTVTSMARSRRLMIAFVASVVALWSLGLSSAFGFDIPIGGPSGTPPFSTYTCQQCHAADSVAYPADGSGPHKHYSATTRKCAVCHKVHNAPAGGILLLPGATVSATCQTCHDGTAAKLGVYTAITSRTGSVLNVKAEHTVDATKAIPGGSTALTATMGCSSCHSVHGANTVVPFLRDSGNAGVNAAGGYDDYVTSDCLLRSDLRGAVAGTYPEYGAMWCAACHDQRHSNAAPTTLNHSVNTDAAWGYDDVITTNISPWRVDNAGPGFSRSMGRTNAGYIMAPVPESGDGHVATRAKPMCQQCHEDARDVEGVFDGDYTGRGATEYEDGSVVPFLTFPHQTTNLKMTVENDDDLCLNCHSLGTLP